MDMNKSIGYFELINYVKRITLILASIFISYYLYDLFGNYFLYFVGAIFLILMIVIFLVYWFFIKFYS